ncbi:hypothetical protein DMP07_07635 [Slackia faecicanis]|uniref:Helix-turn-helix domain-containing protein n=1 Tax=Slackia faecicanis TaxID=255723 RepID=A0A3N0ADI7_9ACTN|nr:helix-turn-helix domain-containing protein [Slackia faecicanis]RNL18818.1 hypothetical protein DMP07_07635 [Slackia faecicanis]
MAGLNYTQHVLESAKSGRMGIRPLLTPKQAAEVLCVCDKTVRTLCREGRIKGVKIGSAWRVAPQELERFIREGGCDE